jgi:hypothetical protein
MDGRSAHHKAATYTKRINALSGIRTHYPSVRANEDSLLDRAASLYVSVL